jgi:hypothetical protein
MPQPGLCDESVHVARVEISRVLGGGGGSERVVGLGGGDEVEVVEGEEASTGTTAGGARVVVWMGGARAVVRMGGAAAKGSAVPVLAEGLGIVGVERRRVEGSRCVCGVVVVVGGVWTWRRRARRR